MKKFRINNVARNSTVGFGSLSMSSTSAAPTGDMRSSEKDQSLSDNNIATTEPDFPKWNEQARSAWRQGKAQTLFLLNDHLKNFDIKTHVDGGHIILQGAVTTSVEKDLAEALASSIQGVESVENRLHISSNTSEFMESNKVNADNLSQSVQDASLTASIKKQLIQSPLNHEKIHVQTSNATVVLNGETHSIAYKNLADSIARKTEGTLGVNNTIRVNDVLTQR